MHDLGISQYLALEVSLRDLHAGRCGYGGPEVVAENLARAQAHLAVRPFRPPGLSLRARQSAVARDIRPTWHGATCRALLRRKHSMANGIDTLRRICKRNSATTFGHTVGKSSMRASIRARQARERSPRDPPPNVAWEPGPIMAKFGPDSAKRSRIRPQFPHIWQPFGQPWPGSTDFWPILANFGPDCFKFCRTRLESAEFGTDFVGPNVPEFGTTEPSLSQNQPTSAGCGPTSTEFARIRASPGQLRPNAGRCLSSLGRTRAEVG